ncbi:Transposable element Tcb2 transposase [Merluccius polli]|uniref:Transposable element Tcb2 transposase n=1 Tax=Merluccius polli TaxID=89951 RepID=A0AA47MJG9_MERPO|nr:Transposable element Tcb2 transposase [Merluccius polli]
MATAPARCYPPPSGPSAVLSPPASRTNRLRRSLRSPAGPEAAGSPRYRETAHLNNKQGGSPPPAEFKTPTRVPRSKYTASFCGGGVLESPNNDGDLTQDIVWDAASPSPVRAGKRGKSRAAGAAIGISEIVRRIAPMHGRPEVVEPTLQEWIGDSAAIPCTPEVQHPKAKKKSPRHGQDDLLQFKPSIRMGKKVPIEHRVKATDYLSIVADHVHPFMTTVYPSSDGYFQQDNAPCHKARIISDWFLEHDNEFTVLKWPPQSPDLNPIEHLWDVVEREIRIMDVQPTNLQQLRDAIMSIWTKLSEECFQYLVESVPRRIKAVLKAKGGPTRY